MSDARENYSTVYQLLEDSPEGMTAMDIARVMGVSSHNVQRWLNNMGTEGFLTYFEGDVNYAYCKTDPPTGRGKPTKRDKRQVNGEPIRFGKWI